MPVFSQSHLWLWNGHAAICIIGKWNYFLKSTSLKCRSACLVFSAAQTTFPDGLREVSFFQILFLLPRLSLTICPCIFFSQAVESYSTVFKLGRGMTLMPAVSSPFEICPLPSLPHPIPFVPRHSLFWYWMFLEIFWERVGLSRFASSVTLGNSNPWSPAANLYPTQMESWSRV